MKFDLRQPCVECPFRRNHPSGWLGPWDVDDLMHHIQADGLFPCHRTIKEDDRTMDEPDMQQCAGAAIFLSNQCKLHRNPAIAAYQKVLQKLENVSLKIRQSVFQWPQEFRDHHKKVLTPTKD